MIHTQRLPGKDPSGRNWTITGDLRRHTLDEVCEEYDRRIKEEAPEETDRERNRDTDVTGLTPREEGETVTVNLTHDISAASVEQVQTIVKKAILQHIEQSNRDMNVIPYPSK